MSILDPIRAYSTPLTLVLVIFGPQLLNRTLAYLAQRNRPLNSATPAHPHSVALLRRLKVFLALHTLYHLSHLLIPPYDLFSTPHLPILAPNDLLRPRLSPSSMPMTGESNPNPLIDLLLSRLQNLDNRLLYLRFGHRSLQDCLWCATPLDYLVASLPDILARYAWAAGVIMLLGSRAAGDGAELRGKRWGGAGLWAVGIMCLAEIGVKYLWDLRITSGDTFHLAHTIHLARTAVLLLLPLLHSFLPPAPTPPNPAVLLHSIQNAQNTSRLSSLLREAVQNDGRLSQIWAIGNSHQAAMTKAAHSDPEVKQAILDYRIGNAPADHARAWVEEGWSGLVHASNRGQADRNIT